MIQTNEAISTKADRSVKNTVIVGCIVGVRWIYIKIARKVKNYSVLMGGNSFVF